MSVASDTPRVVYTPNLEDDVYDIPFQFDDDAEIQVWLNRAGPLVLGTDYTLVGAGLVGTGVIGGHGRALTFVSPGALASKAEEQPEGLTIARFTHQWRETAFVNGAPLYPGTLEQQYDLLSLQVQDLQRDVNRTVRVRTQLRPVTHIMAPLDDFIDRAGYLLVVNEDETAVVLTSFTDLLENVLEQIIQQILNSDYFWDLFFTEILEGDRLQQFIDLLLSSEEFWNTFITQIQEGDRLEQFIDILLSSNEFWNTFLTQIIEGDRLEQFIDVLLGDETFYDTFIENYGDELTTFVTNIYNVDPQNLITSLPYTVVVNKIGLGTDAEFLHHHKVESVVAFGVAPAGANPAIGGAGFNQCVWTADFTASKVYTVKKNGVAFLTVTIPAGAVHTPVFAFDPDITKRRLVPTDILSFHGPATADATGTNLSITLAGSRKVAGYLD